MPSRKTFLLEAYTNDHILEPDHLSFFITGGVRALDKHAPVKIKHVRAQQAQ